MTYRLLQTNLADRGNCAVILCQQSALEAVDIVIERLKKSGQRTENADSPDIRNRLVAEIAVFEVFVVCRQLFSMIMPRSRIGRAIDRWTGRKKEATFRDIESAIMTTVAEKFRRDFAVNRVQKYSEGGDFSTISIRFAGALQESYGGKTIETTIDLAAVISLIWGEAAKVADFIMKEDDEQILVTTMKSLNNLNLPDLAIKKADQLLAVNPNHPHALFSKGFALARQGKTDGLTYMDRAAALDPEIASYMREKGISAEHGIEGAI